MKFEISARQVNDDGSIGWEIKEMCWNDCDWKDITFLQDLLVNGVLAKLVEAGYEMAAEPNVKKPGK